MEIKEIDGRWFAKKSKKAKTWEDVSDIIEFDGDFCTVMGKAGRTSFHSYLGKIGKRWVEMYGVTSLLNFWGEKERLLQWAVDRAVDFINEKRSHSEDILNAARSAHKRSLEDAGAHGTDVHQIVEDWIKYSKITEHEQLRQFIEWVEDSNVKILHSELPLRSKSKWLAGTCDGVCEIDGKTYIFDVKTGNYLSPKNWFQCAAYAMMYEEMGKGKIDGSILIHLPRKGGFKVLFTEDIQKDKEAFNGIYTAFRHEKNLSSSLWSGQN